MQSWNADSDSVTAAILWCKPHWGFFFFFFIQIPRYLKIFLLILQNIWKMALVRCSVERTATSLACVCWWSCESMRVISQQDACSPRSKRQSQAHMVLQHISNSRQAIVLITELTRPGGFMFCLLLCPTTHARDWNRTQPGWRSWSQS